METEPPPSAQAAPRRASTPDSDAVLLAVQQQHEEDLRKLKAQYQQRIDGFAIEILDSYLEGADWEAAFAGFFRRNASLFASFDSARGYDLQMTEVHKSFLATLDALLDAQLARLDLPAARCAEWLCGGVAPPSSAALPSVRAKLERYTDFLTFGAMMHQRHAELSAARRGEGGDASTAEARADADEPACGGDEPRGGIAGGAARRHTRVLWDLENVCVPSGAQPLDVVHGIESWLSRLGYWGAGVDGLISAFFNPDHTSRALRTALDRAGVEQVLASSKREDADRKIVARLQRELALLPAGEQTVVVFITSDTDFIPQLRQLRGRGGPVLVVHAAPPHSQQLAALSHAATAIHSWQHVLSHASPSGAAEEEEEASTPQSGGRTSRARGRGASEGGAKGGGAASAPPAGMAGFDASTRYGGVCEAWNGKKGFGFLCVDGGKGRLFVHNTAIRTPTDGQRRRALRRSERVTFLVTANAKGPMAVDVVPEDAPLTPHLDVPASHPAEQQDSAPQSTPPTASAATTPSSIPETRVGT
ncbi:hypothetical protein AB1Y20_011405 [Prymnesium parvum]|uniref:CSD domain-containing protein n=1 Tax=Prymnesium parvum TaxID=97485 RepID=A0AB34IQ19_PRYPA